jgi:hypothetical protein
MKDDRKHQSDIRNSWGFVIVGVGVGGSIGAVRFGSEIWGEEVSGFDFGRGFMCGLNCFYF